MTAYRTANGGGNEIFYREAGDRARSPSLVVDDLATDERTLKCTRRSCDLRGRFAV